MKKILTFFAGAMIAGSLFAGGLVTNTNQSARFTRLASRNASTGIDAVYYNPAGLTKLGNGLFCSLNNQTVGQQKSIKSTFPFLSGVTAENPKEYIGKVSAPLFPGVYVAYNTGKFSFSAGFNPIGGGGGATYDKGLPSFEMDVASLVPATASQFGTTGYDATIFFEGSSKYMGYQANIGYEISKMLSVAVGGRYVTAANTYSGYIKDIKINPNYPAFGATYTGGMVLASEFFTSGANFLTTLKDGAAGFATGLGPIISGGGGSVLLANGTIVGLTAFQVGQIQQLIGAAGQNPANLTIAQAQGILQAAAPAFAANALKMANSAALTQDRYVDASKSGSGFTPIISANFSPSDKLNIAVRYEFKTKLDLITKVNDNKGGGIFFQDSVTISDMPAQLSAGIEYMATKKLLLSASMNYYFDKKVDYDGSATKSINMIDKNFKEFSIGLQYGLTDKLAVSAGWLGTYTGVNTNYQNDQNYSLNTNSFGAGFGFKISKMLELNIGGQYTFYQEGTKGFEWGTARIPVTETYNKNTWVVAVGLDFSFGK